MIGHTDLTCPLEGCGSKLINAKGEGYRCQVCNSEFLPDGTIIKTGWKSESAF